MVLLYPNKNIFLYGFNHKLGSIRRDLNQLQTEGLLLGSPRLSAHLAISITLESAKMKRF